MIYEFAPQARVPWRLHARNYIVVNFLDFRLTKEHPLNSSLQYLDLRRTEGRPPNHSFRH